MKAKIRVIATPSSDSSRVLSAQLEGFLHESLGNPIESYGKAAVMLIANGGIKVPKFSKYSGVCEWRDCVFLWVNMYSHMDAASKCQYPNEFLDKGRLIKWFGGSKMSQGNINCDSLFNICNFLLFR